MTHFPSYSFIDLKNSLSIKITQKSSNILDKKHLKTTCDPKLCYKKENKQRSTVLKN